MQCVIDFFILWNSGPVPTHNISESFVALTITRSIQFRSKATLPLPPPVKGAGYETLSAGARVEGEGECIPKRQSAILNAGYYRTVPA